MTSIVFERLLGGFWSAKKGEQHLNLGFDLQSSWELVEAIKNQGNMGKKKKLWQSVGFIFNLEIVVLLENLRQDHLYAFYLPFVD